MPTYDLIPTSVAAQLLGTTVATVNRRAARGELPEAVKITGYRGARLFDRAMITELAVSELYERIAALVAVDPDALVFAARLFDRATIDAIAFMQSSGPEPDPEKYAEKFARARRFAQARIDAERRHDAEIMGASA